MSFGGRRRTVQSQSLPQECLGLSHYVVRLNEDMPYDQFIREQIAGDSYNVGEATGFGSGPPRPAATVGRELAIRQARAIVWMR